MGSVGNNQIYSDVDSRTTPMSDEDKKQVSSDFGTSYFQTSNSFTINEILRNTDNDDNLLQNLREEYTFTKADKVYETIQAMDRNMQPLNDSIKVVRLADMDYITSVLQACGVDISVNAFGEMRYSDVVNSINDIKNNVIGATIYEKGYMSTTYNTSLSDSAFTGRPVKLEMDVPKGAKAMFSPTGEESELVVARNSGYTVNDIRLENGDIVLSVKVLR